VRIVNYDAWLMSDIDFDRFHGFGNEKAEPSDYATEAAMEKIIKEKTMQMELVKSDAGETNSLLTLAIEKGLDTDKLQKLIELRNEELARQAKEEFDRHFAEMQAELPAIKKGAEAKDRNGKVMYVYAPLETLQAEAGPVIAKHGFSYSWREEVIDGGKRIILTITGYGHSRETSFDVPKIEGNAIQNPVQAAGAMSSYGKRYTFIAGFGLTVEGEDDDAGSLTFEDGVKYGAYVKTINACSDMEELKARFIELYKELAGDITGQKALTVAKDQKKKELACGSKN